MCKQGYDYSLRMMNILFLLMQSSWCHGGPSDKSKGHRKTDSRLYVELSPGAGKRNTHRAEKVLLVSIWEKATPILCRTL